MRSKITPYVLMAAAMGLCPWHDDRTQPRQTPDIPRDDEGHARAAQAKRDRRAAKKNPNQPRPEA